MTEHGAKTSPQLTPFDERIEILVKELELAIKWQRPCILLVVYSSDYVRADARNVLGNHLMDLGQRVSSLRVQNQETDDVIRLLKQFKEPASTTFFVDGLRWGHSPKSSIYTALNLQREFFIEKRVRVIFWLTQKEIMDLARFAPDFWAFRHRVVEFVESPKAEQVLQQALDSAWQGTGEYTDQFEDTDAKISLREALLTELPKGEEASSTRANLLLTLGILNWRKGDYEKADEQLRTALKIATKMQDNWFEAECFNAVALVKTSMERMDEAIEAYKQAIRLAPDQIFAWNNLGNLCAKIGRNDEAIIAFLKAIECNSQDPIAWNGLGNVYNRIGYVDDAIAAYRKSIQFMPTFAQPWSGLGDVYAGTGRVDEALKAYHKAIDLNKHYVAPWLRLAVLYDKQDRFRDAIKAYQRALSLDSKNCAVWNELGLIHLKCEAYDEAAEAFSKAIELDRSYGWAYSNLALAYAQQGRHQESIALYLKSTDLLKENKDKAVAWNRLGNAYRQINDYDNAIAAYQMADMLDLRTPQAGEQEASNETIADENIELHNLTDQASETPSVAAQAVSDDPQRDNAEASSSAVSEQTGMPYWILDPALSNQVRIEAELSVRKFANQRESNVPSMSKVKGVPMTRPTSPSPSPIPSMDSKKNYEIRELEESKADSANPHVWNEKGNVHFKRGEFEDAIRAYNRAIQLDPAFGWPYTNLALTYLTQNQYAEAILLYQKSLDLLTSDKDKAISWNGLGNIYRCIDDYPNAIAAYQKAAELDPETAGMRDGADNFQSDQQPKNAQAWNDLGELFFKTGSYDEAVNAFEQAIKLDPEAGWPYTNLARVLAAQGKWAEAVPLHQKSIELLQDNKDKAVVLNRLGSAYRRLNNYDDAIKAYQKAVMLADEGVTLATRTRFSLLSNVSGD